MSTFERVAAVVFLALGGGVVCAQQGAWAGPRRGPGLGVPATAAQVAARDLSIPPDGRGLPPGSGTARVGAKVYAAQCIGCHGKNGAGGPDDRLAGGRGSLKDAHPVRTVGSYWPYATTLFDYIRRAMPYPLPHSLSDDEAYALTAYLLYLNGIVAQDDTIDAQTLPDIVMPNRDGFIRAYPPVDRAGPALH